MLVIKDTINEQTFTYTHTERYTTIIYTYNYNIANGVYKIFQNGKVQCVS